MTKLGGLESPHFCLFMGVVTVVRRFKVRETSIFDALSGFSISIESE
jgi:hypothetical protein